MAPAPAFDRRALERFAVGAPPPTPSPAIRAIERGARVTNGWLLRAIRSTRIRPPALSAPARTVAPEISIGVPIARRNSANDVSFEPLYLLVPGESSRASGSAAIAAVQAAERFSGGRSVVLIDLDPESGRLRQHLGTTGSEGIVEALEFGISLSAVGVPLGRDSRFVPLGAPPADLESLFSHEGWKRVVARARRGGVRLLAYVPPDRARIEAVARNAGAILLLATPEEESRLSAVLPPGIPVVGAFEPRSLTAVEKELFDAADAAEEAQTRSRPGTERAQHETTGADFNAHAGVAAAASVEEAAEPLAAEPPRGAFAEILARERERAALLPLEPPVVEPAPTPVEREPVAPPALEVDPPMEAPTARGLTLAAWLAEEEQRLASEYSGPPEAQSAWAQSEPTPASAPPRPASPAPTTELSPAPAAEAPAGAAGSLADWLAREIDEQPVEVPRAPQVPTESAPATVEEKPVVTFAETVEAILSSPPLAEEMLGPVDDAERSATAPAQQLDEPSPDGLDETVGDGVTAWEATPAAVESWDAIPATPEAAPTATATARRELLDRGASAMHRYSVPRTSERTEIAIRTAGVIIIAYWTYYIGWRWLETLNFDALWFSIPLALAETWGWMTAVFLLFTVWRLNHRELTPAPPGLSVDVFITTYDEPLEVIRRTAISAREIRYPHKTYVLDDGRREELRVMAAELGVGYITRDNNDHAKAGNLNNALKYTSSDFILQLDADHAPLPHMLDRLLGFFKDERVAFVQTPQDFYNTDSFTSDVDEEAQRIWEEQRLFFSVVQPGKDAWNSAFFCGSCAVIRRAALDEIGGFSVQSVTEDIETSLLLHARGWKSVYHGESLAFGLAASSAAAFHIQHGRWAQGGMQVLRKFNPLTFPGLSPAQRLGYFFSLSGYVAGLQKLIFYSAPIIFFLTGVLPIRALDNEFLIRFVPYFVFSIALVELLSRGLGFTWIAERYQMAKFWTYTRALPTFFTNKRLRFRVTPKGPSHVPFGTYAPQLTLMVATVISVYFATFAFAQGWVSYPVPGWRSLAFQLNFLWGAVNFILAAYVVRLSMRLQQQRQDHRFSDRFPIHIRPRGRQGRLGERQLALTEDLNSSGVSFRSVQAFEAGTELKITLPLSTQEVNVNGVVVHVRPVREPGVPAFSHGVEFRDVPLDVRDAIEIHCAHHAVPFKQMQYKMVGKAFSTTDEDSRERGETRRQIRLPTWVVLGDREGIGGRQENVAFLDEIGEGGASLIMNEAVPPGTPIIFEVPGTDIRGEGLTTFSRALETPIGVRFVVGVRMGNAPVPPIRKFSMRSFLPSGRAAVMVGLLVAGTAFGASPARAQLSFSAYGAAEMDTRDQSLLLVGATVQSSAAGWAPYGSLQIYRLVYPLNDETATLDALVPSFGVRRTFGVATLQAGVGYLFLASDEASVLGAPGGGGEGVVVDGVASYRAGPQTGQVIASYNFGDSYLWSRGRAARDLLWNVGGSAAALGGEVVFQGGGKDGSFHAFQLAPTLEVQATATVRVLGAIGWKTDDLPRTRGGGFPYARLEFGYSPP